MAKRQYIAPQLPAGTKIAELQPVDLDTTSLTADRIVTCIHRGAATLTVQHDARHYDIAPGYFQCTYAAALHFRQRLIVPGSRDRNVGRGGAARADSYIAILGVDPEERCQPFDKVELTAIAAKTEGLDRATAERKDQKVVKVKTATVRGRVPGQGAGRVKNAAASQIEDQGSDEARERARTAFTPPADAAPITEEQ